MKIKKKRVTRIELVFFAWKANDLPLVHTRETSFLFVPKN